MNVSTFIAKRYLFSKKSRNIINVISIISFLGIFISASADLSDALLCSFEVRIESAFI